MRVPGPLVFWPVAVLVVSATVFDLYERRIPNILTVPMIIFGLLYSALSGGLKAFNQSLLGISVAIIALGIFCIPRAMGMGDLKLCAAVGSWIGLSQMMLALMLTALFGGLIAAGVAVCGGFLRQSLRSLGLIVVKSLRLAHHRGSTAGSSGGSGGVLTIHSPGARSIPYAPAIAMGTLLSFFGKP